MGIPLNLSKEWDFSKNTEDINSDLKKTKKYHWVCKKGHKWKATLSHRMFGRNCPYCAGQKVLINDSFAKNSKYIAEWDFDKNSLDPFCITIKSSRRVWWKCKNGHNWKAAIHTRTVKNTKCPYCAGKIACEDNNLEIEFPNLIGEWDFNKNGSPTDYLPKSNKKVWWKCKDGHEWEAKILNRTVNNSNCPYCSGTIVSKCNSFGESFPELLEEWDDNRSPFKIHPYSSKKVWWKCKNNHKWQATVNHRSNGSGCPKCSNRVSKKSQKWLDMLKISNKFREKYIKIEGKKFYFDALKDNVVYEFYGDYWHGNPKVFNENDLNPHVGLTYGELYKNTTKREILLKKHGFKMVSIWEKDWDSPK